MMTVSTYPRAKAIEAMARAMYARAVGDTRESQTWHDDARAALAALEQEGLVLTDTREVQRLRAEVRRLGSALADALVALDEAGCQVAASDAHRAVLACVPVDTRKTHATYDEACPSCRRHGYGCALSSVPVEEESDGS